MSDTLQELRDEILIVKKHLKEMEDQIDRAEKHDYEKSSHKSFKIGDIVTNGNHIGKVKWIENLNIDLREHQGWMGIDLLNGTRDFLSGVARNDYSLVNKELLDFYKQGHTVTISRIGGCKNTFVIDGCDVEKCISYSIPEHIKNLISVRFEEYKNMYFLKYSTPKKT